MRIFQVKFILLLSYLLFSANTAFLQGADNLITIDCFSDFYKEKLESFLPESFFLEAVCYDIDFSYDKKNLQYLTGLQEFSQVSREGILSACFYLQQIDRFRKIDLVIESKKKGYVITFKLVGHMLFESLSISGFARDKDIYKNMYLLDIGEVFDQSKHKHSMQHIKEIFYDKGYCNVQILDDVKQDLKNKEVAVHLSLIKGPLFKIRDIDFKVDALGSINQTDVLRIKDHIHNVCYKRLKSKVYNQELLKKIKIKIKSLLTCNGFMNFDITSKQKIHEVEHLVDLEFCITLERKKEFVFFGNHFFSNQEIQEQFLMYGKSSWHFPPSIIIDEIEQLYKNKGFWDVSVSVREEKNRVFCLITENHRYEVRGVFCKNNHHISSDVLKNSVFKSFLKKKYFDKDSLKKSLDELVIFYKQRGFWDVKVVKEEFVPAGKPYVFDLLVTVDEGNQRKIGRYKVPDYAELEKQAPFLMLGKKRDAGFDPMIIVEQKQWLMRYFRNKGYSKPIIEYILQEHNGELDLVWKIKLDERALHFGKPLIIGNSVIPESYILREIMFKQGDVWDKTKLEDTIKGLRSLEVFDSVQIYPSRKVDDNLQKPIFIKVIDASKYEIKARMGAQQVGNSFVLKRGFTYKIGASFILKNPFHYGDKFSIETDFTRFYRDVAAVYQFPWLFGKSIRCQYKLYDNVYDQPVYIGSKYSLYQAAQQGFLFNMTKQFGQVTLSGSSGFEYMGIKQADEPDLGRIIDYDRALLGRKLGYLFFEPNVIWQRADSVVNPKKGHLSYVSLKTMIDLNHKTTFCKLLIEHAWYMPLFEKFVLGFRLRGGHVFNREFSQLIPIERFYLGGESTIRGYDRDYCPPLGLLTVPIVDASAGLPAAACNTWRFAPQGGRTMINLNSELRFPVYKGLGAAIFTDMGALFKDSIYGSIKHHGDNLFTTSGFGFRYDTPIGPLRFDIGFKWNKILKDFETRSVWYLTFGQAF